jgi:hypothetical protein
MSTTITPTKIVAYDTKINYRLIQFFQFFSQKISFNLLFVNSYYEEINDVVTTSIGHNKTHYELFLKFKTMVDIVYITTTQYININPPLEEEGVYLLQVKTALKNMLNSFAHYVHNFGKLWLGEKKIMYNEDYTIVDTDVISSSSLDGGIINNMNKKQVFILYSILTIITRSMEQTNNYFLTLFQKLDKNNENIQQITLVLFPKLFIDYESVVFFLFVSSIDFNIIINNRENIFITNVNQNFTDKITSAYKKIIDLDQTIQTIFSLI